MQSETDTAEMSNQATFALKATLRKGMLRALKAMPDAEIEQQCGSPITSPRIVAYAPASPGGSSNTP
jgi:hypothetical protein